MALIKFTALYGRDPILLVEYFWHTSFWYPAMGLQVCLYMRVGTVILKARYYINETGFDTFLWFSLHRISPLTVSRLTFVFYPVCDNAQGSKLRYQWPHAVSASGVLPSHHLWVLTFNWSIQRKAARFAHLSRQLIQKSRRLSVFEVEYFVASAKHNWVLRACASYKIFYCLAEYHTHHNALLQIFV